ncbi:hypothetical protein [Massilia cavernae]|uniref:Type II secretion system protein n=1 Tax=Massilia cavernae TaxID=2320864 RepID=A0A418Y7M0_9BURK|nr:hypothetical protein [Massilia cavernae]RJG25819.1 hypothetical protein D3872_02650 [Massilia cavernae]
MRIAPPAARRRRIGGFTLFEAAIAAIVVALLLGILLKRLQIYQQEAELVAVRQLVGTLRMALSVRNAQLVVARKEHLLRRVIDENPMTWLANPPLNYLGEYYSPQGNTLPAGNWYFDLADKSLVYISSGGKSLSDGRLNLLRFKVKSSNFSLQSGKQFGPPSVIEGVVLDEAYDHGAGK